MRDAVACVVDTAISEMALIDDLKDRVRDALMDVVADRVCALIAALRQS